MMASRILQGAHFSIIQRYRVLSKILKFSDIVEGLETMHWVSISIQRIKYIYTMIYNHHEITLANQSATFYEYDRM